MFTSVGLKNKKPLNLFVFYFLAALLNFLVIEPIVLPQYSLVASNEQTCEGNLELAENNYYDGNFEETIRLIRECLKDTDLKKSERIRAYKILSRTMLAQNNSVTAKEIINKIFDLEPEFQPTIEQETPQFVTTVNEVKNERQKKSIKQEESGSNVWYWIAGGAATAAVVAILFIDPNGDDPQVESNTLPEPPKFP